ncbi:DUF2092 domain-containing protein [Paraburkholderia sp. J12]|uniref:DUF2092 domain-containing protein n=1 Tax=Paraburkholderia sp. J12 TaxID=2805432 RepID=UPI002ABE4938|nr:DUF2092 domain-containing protein [Paraburkholderia sp. J12]
MNKRIFPVALAAAVSAAIVLAGCAHPEGAGHEQAQSNVPSPLADLEGAASDTAAASAPSAASEAPAPAVDPQASAALDAMASYLRTLRSFEVDADTSTDVVLDNGQNAALVRHTLLEVRRPDRLRGEIAGNGNVRGIVYDGHYFTVFNQKKGYYSRNDAPPTLDDLTRELANTWHIELPLADLFYWGYGKEDNLALTSARVLGVEKIGARWCTHYAYQQPGLDWELWIEQGDRPLPCRTIMTDTTQTTRPRHDVTYHWKLGVVFPASTFAFHPEAGEKAIEMKPAEKPPSEETD